MSDARTEVLARIRAALADCPVGAAVPRDYDVSRPVGGPLGLPAERVADYQATVRRVRGGHRAAGRRLMSSRAVRISVKPWRPP